MKNVFEEENRQLLIAKLEKKFSRISLFINDTDEEKSYLKSLREWEKRSTNNKDMII